MATLVPLSPVSSPDAGVPEGGLALLVLVGSPGPPIPPPSTPPSEDAMAVNDEDVKDGCVDVDVTNDEVADFARAVVEAE